MKLALFILSFFILSFVNAQNLDELIIESLKQKFHLSKYDFPDEIIKFNNDTIIVVGCLEDLSSSVIRYEQVKNTTYKTEDGGKNWKVIKFNGDGWIYNSYHNSKGEVWMGGSDEYIHYSPDFGNNWERKIKPFQPVDRVLSIFMVNSKFGISGGLGNGLSITEDNWATSTEIKTPIDQKTINFLRGYGGDRVNKIGIIDSLIIINQNENIYYSNLNKIIWTEFNIPVSDFIIDESRKEIHLYSRNGKRFIISSKLDLIDSYEEEFKRNEIKPDTTSIDIDSFFKYGIKTIKITSTKWTVGKKYHMSRIYNSNIEEFIYDKINDTLFSYKNESKININNISTTFKNSEVIIPIYIALKNISFTEQDYNDFSKKYQRRNLKSGKNWGRNITDQIPMNHLKFKNFKSSLDSIKTSHIDIIFDDLYRPNKITEKYSNEIFIEITNSNNESLLVSNKFSYIFSLPWTIEVNNTIITSYNTKITEYIRSILPKKMNNEEMLLGGELIYKLINEQIIDEIEYKKNGF